MCKSVLLNKGFAYYSMLSCFGSSSFPPFGKKRSRFFHPLSLNQKKLISALLMTAFSHPFSFFGLLNSYPFGKKRSRFFHLLSLNQKKLISALLMTAFSHPFSFFGLLDVDLCIPKIPFLKLRA